jgi:hypothetical protein
MKCSYKKSYILLALVILAITLSQTAYSAPILQGFINNDGSWYTYDVDDGGVTRSAEAGFSVVDNVLTITLTNTAGSTNAPNEVLAGLFFDFSGGLTGAPLVSLTDGSVIVSGDGAPLTPSPLNGEWAYLAGINDMNGGRGDYGISATSLDPDDGLSADGWQGFGSDDVIDPSENTNNPVSADGWDYGLVGDVVGINNFNDYAIQSSATITWNIVNPGTISNVWFLYGTDYEDAPPVPEPSTMILIGTGLIGLVSFGRKFRKDN